MPEDLLRQQAPLSLDILTVLEAGLKQDYHTSTSPSFHWKSHLSRTQWPWKSEVCRCLAAGPATVPEQMTPTTRHGQRWPLLMFFSLCLILPFFLFVSYSFLLYSSTLYCSSTSPAYIVNEITDSWHKCFCPYFGKKKPKTQQTPPQVLEKQNNFRSGREAVKASDRSLHSQTEVTHFWFICRGTIRRRQCHPLKCLLTQWRM